MAKAKKNKHGRGIAAGLLAKWEEALTPSEEELAKVKACSSLASLHLYRVLKENSGLLDPCVNAAARLAFQRAGVMPETEARVAAVNGKVDDGKLEVVVTFQKTQAPADDDG